MKSLAAALAALALLPSAAPAQAPSPAVFAWLEDVEGPQALAWVAAQNARTAARLEADPRYPTFLAEAQTIFTARDRIPAPQFRGGGIDNFWQDAAHVHGAWRRTTRASYRAARPHWETLLDLDDLSKAEGRNWIWKGVDCLRPDERLCLVRLSDGGGDAIEIREFDVLAKRFVTGGFVLAEGKQQASWIDRDHLVVGREWTPDEVTASGYPFVVKIATREAPPREVFRGARSDVEDKGVVLAGADGRADAVIIDRGESFYAHAFSLLTDGEPAPIPLPPKAEYQAYVAGQAVFVLKAAWRGFAAGAVVSYDLAALKRDPQTAAPQLVFQPGPREAVQTVEATRSRLIITLLEDVKGAVLVSRHTAAGWRGRRLALPRGLGIVEAAASGADDQAAFTAEGFLAPTSLWLADAASAAVARVKALPPRFDASADIVEQHWATSSDGTRIPYFLVRPKIMRPDGSTPTILYGYGGFEIARPPAYLPEMGRIWLSRGGAYAIANIRGGGEFGPAWHEAALRENRQRAFDDFAAVARDLIARKVTSPRRLGIYGRSNGGVLVTAEMIQHPELWNAVVAESPLIDMLRYSRLSAGASWVAEYGDPDVPADRAFIARYSAPQNLKPGVRYPEPYLTTNTRDDRVHPAHARMFAAELAAMGQPYLYYEQTFGGHANDADPELNARRWARHYVYLAQKLMD
jgi:prolyl oligopeptidase